MRVGLEPLEARGLMSVAVVPPVRQAELITPQGVYDVSTDGSVTRDAGSVQAAADNHGGILALRNVMYPTPDGGTQLLDLYEPAGPAPPGGWPAVVAVHGGGWYKFSKDDFGKVVSPLTRAGYAVAAVDYQLSLPGVSSWPGNIDDVRAAVRWVRQDASLLGVNPNEIATLGESAGGHLATLAAYDPSGAPAGSATSASTADASQAAAAKVQAVVDFYGPTNLKSLVNESPTAASRVVQFVGGTPDQLPGLYASASPVNFVGPGSPPTLIIQGTEDHTVPASQSQELASALSSAGVPHSLILVPGAGHEAQLGRGLVFNGHSYLPTVVDFLNTNLKHPQAASSA